MTRSASSKVPIVFLAIASSEVLRTRDLKALEQEHRELQKQYENAQNEGRCQLVDRFAVTLDGFFDVFRDTTYAGRVKVLHFAGHAGDEVLVMETEDGQKKLAGAAGLAEFLSAKSGLHLVFLNGCHTQAQIANLHAAGIPVVIATIEEVEDEQARIFAVNFHAELSKGSSIETAFRSASGALKAASHGNTAALAQWILSAPNEQDKQWSLTSDLRVSAPCRMLFPKNEAFVGREEDLENLHRALLGNNAVGIRPAGLTGLGGIGKTQLAVEYCYLHQSSYPTGIFWINAAQNWSEQFAELGMLLVPGLTNEPQIRQVQAAAEYLRTHHDCLLVMDNVAEPAQLRQMIAPDLVPSSLPCQILFTTRRRDLGAMSAVEVTFLPLEPALRLLLRADLRQPVLDLDHPEHVDACAIYRMLGGLPLALEIAGAFLAEWPQISVSDFRQRLHREGRLATLDKEGEELSSTNISGIHEAAVSATLGEQWEALGTSKQVDEDARLVLRIASQLAEAEVIPAARLGLLAGLAGENIAGGPSRLERALHRLKKASLIEELHENELRLHPLVHEFVGSQIAPTEIRSFRHMCAHRLLATYQIVDNLEAHCTKRGVDAVAQDLKAALELVAGTLQEHEEVLHLELRRLLRMVQHESLTLRDWGASKQPAYFLQQWHKRAVIEGEQTQALAATEKIRGLIGSFLGYLWSTSSMHLSLEYLLDGHKERISTIMITLDGRLAVTASDDCTLKVWNLETGSELQTVFCHAGPISALSVTGDGTRAISASDNTRVTVWDLRSGNALRVFVGHKAEVVAVAVTPDGKRAVSASWDGELKVWNPASERVLENGEFDDVLHTFTDHEDSINAVVVTADGKRAVSASDDNTLIVWDLEGGRKLHVLRGHRSSVYAVALTPDERRVVSVSDDETIKVWNLDTGHELLNVRHNTGSLYALAIAPNGRRALLSSAKGEIEVWDLLEERKMCSLKGHDHYIDAIAVAANGSRAVSASDEGQLKVWDLEEGRELCNINGHRLPVTALAVAPNGQEAVSASEDNMLYVWDLKSKNVQDCVGSGHAGPVTAMAITPDGRSAVSASNDDLLKVWDVKSGRNIRTIHSYLGHVCSLKLTADGRFVASVGDEEGAIVRYVQNDRYEYSFGREIRGARAVALSPGGYLAGVGFEDGTVEFWDLVDHREVCTLDGDGEPVSAISFATDSMRAVSVSTFGMFTVWDLETKMELRRFGGHTGPVNAVTLAFGGRRAVTVSNYHTVTVWDLESGSILHTFPDYAGKTIAATLIPAGWLVVTALQDRTVKMWDLRNGSNLTSPRHDTDVTCLEVSGDGKRVLVGDANGNVHCLQQWNIGDTALEYGD